MAEIKTKQTSESVEAFLGKVKNQQQREDSLVLVNMMKKASGEEPRMWGSSMIGFGFKRYKSPNSGREVDWFRLGFSPRKANLSLHLVLDLKKHEAKLKKLGKFKTGVGCIYITKLADVDLKVLQTLINEGAKK